MSAYTYLFSAGRGRHNGAQEEGGGEESHLGNFL